jgi:hypothetical protein
MPEPKPRDRSSDDPVPAGGGVGGASGALPGALPGTEALQAAALQAIAAAKAFLDLAEQAVRDPEVLGQVASSLSTVAKGVLGGLMPPGAQGRSSGTGGDPDDTPLEHIDVG